MKRERERERGEREKREGKGCNKRNYQSCKHPFDEDECGTCRSNPLPFSQEIFEEEEKREVSRLQENVNNNKEFCRR